MKHTLICLFAALLLQVPSRAIAEFKFATVDINKIINESKDAAGKRKSLEELSQNAKKKIDTKKTALLAMEKKLQESNPSEDSKEVEKYRNEVRNFNRMVKDTEDDLKKEFLKVNQSLTEKTVTVVRQYAKANQIDLVVDHSEKVRGPVLFGSTSVDITDEIIKQINK